MALSFSIRMATQGDVPPLARLAEQTFRATYASYNSAEDMEAYVARFFGLDYLAQDVAAHVYLVAEAEGDLVGYVKLREAANPACLGDLCAWELERIYAATHLKGLGIGRGLMQASIDLTISRGFEGLWLGVWEENTAAIGFYRKLGFVEAGTKSFLLGSDLQTDMVMFYKV